MKWTDEQQKAIYTGGTDILVSAAAGSGKTAVLVERIIQKLINQDHPINIDELLIVTFTNAAAQEMRTRIGAALEKALKQNPRSNHLKRQLSLLQNAHISTLHAFCMEVVRKYSYQLDVDPNFRIADEVEADLLQQDVLEELFEDWYGKEGTERERFFAVVDRFSSDRHDREVEELILKIYEFANQNPWPEHWLDQMVDMYAIGENQDENKHVWLDVIKTELASQLEAMKNEAEQALNITRESQGPYHYADLIDEELKLIREARQKMNGSWKELHQFVQDNDKFKALPRKKIDCDEEKKEQVKEIRNRYKSRWDKVRKSWFSRSLEAYLKDLRDLHPVMEQLSILVKDFHRRYQQKKKEQALVDFSDLEHFCLEILMGETSTPESIQPSPVARQYQQQFSEILVDEYQDTNLVQETILYLMTLGDEAGHLFMVGDVKQSIYRFRHAEPSLFISKYNRFALDDNDQVRIDLSRNFRSRKQVLSACNYIFRQILDQEVGEINYDKDAELIYSNMIYDELTTDDQDVELYLIDNGEKDLPSEDADGEDFRDLEKAQQEARLYAEKIKEWIGQKGQPPLKVVDKQTEQLRNLQYRDIVILLRSMTWAPTIVEELKQQGIPVYAELSTGYFEAIEVQVMLSLLKVIDNPQQDIPLASVLRSPIVGIDEEGLAQLRLAAPKENYYHALNIYVTRGEDQFLKEAIQQFLQKLDNWRVRARQGALSDLIWQIYRETGYYDFVGGIPGGKQRQANLRALYDRARSYENTSFRGLFRFLRFIERMEERGEDLGAARALGEQEDVVRIMTIHKSKGLEFPVVIMGALDQRFNDRDLKEKYLLHKDYGIGVKYIDPDKRIMYPTLAHHALKLAKKREMLAEEMRVLYVALTRAKEKLLMVGCVNDLEKRKEKWQSITDHQEWVLPPHERLEARSYLDWVATALIRHQHGEPLRMADSVNVSEPIWNDESSWRCQIIHASDLTDMEETLKNRHEELHKAITEWRPFQENGDYYDEVDRRLSFTYVHKHAAFHRAKQTVTELKRQRELRDEFSEEQLVRPFQRPIIRRPRFIQEKKTLSAAEKGSAMHAVMQHIPFTRKLSEDEIKGFVEELVMKEVLTKEEALSIDIQAVKAFFDTPIGEMILQSQRIEREIPFSLSLPAHEVYADWQHQSDERVLLQGVIDCLIQTEQGWILLDYKTDKLPEKITEESIKKLANRYELQLSLYARAIEETWTEAIIKKYLYFFDQSLLLEVNG